MNRRPSGNNFIFGGAVAYVLALLAFIGLGEPAYSLEGRVLAWVLFVIGSAPALLYVAKERQHVPIIELVMIAHVIAFSLPVFFETELVLMARTIVAENAPVTGVIALALAAVVALWAGYKLAPRVFAIVPLPKLRLYCHPQKLFYYAVAVCLLTLARGGHFGVYEQIIELAVSQDLAIAILALLFYKGLLSPVKRVVVLLLFSALILRGVSTGLTQQILQPVLIWFICRWFVVKKVQWGIIGAFVIAFVLLQPVKLQYRELVWQPQQSLTMVDKLGIFGQLFVEHWVFQGGELHDKVADSTRNRTSLLLQTAHILDWTPGIVPYENGRTFLYLLFGWVPRFVWTDKPVAQEANIKYALNYGVTTEEGVERTMFGVGELGEAVMNFGPAGVIPVFLLLGMLNYLPVQVVRLPEFRRLRHEAIRVEDIAPLALLIAVVIKLIFIGSSISSLYVGIIQLIVVQAALLYLVAGVRGHASMQVR
jgi:hypothetical protein